MSELWKRLDACRDEVAALRNDMPDSRWDRLLSELESIASAGRTRDSAQDALLSEVALVLSCSQSARVLEVIMDSVIRLSGAERGFLVLQDKDASLKIAAARHMARAPIEAPEMEMSRRIVADVLKSGRLLCIEDARNTPPYNVAESVHRLKILSVLCAPVLWNDHILGAIYLENRRVSGVFSEATEQVVSRFAAQIGAAIVNADSMESLRNERDRLQQAAAKEFGFEGVVGHHPGFLKALHTAAVAAKSDIPIIIQGESGTGKELLARAVHRRSPRNEMRFVSLNCAALPALLLESELFGHRRGAFTGATDDRAGLFASADGGTLFLDEIGDMPIELQSKLLRSLQSGEYRPVGSDDVKHADVRIVVATSRDLEKAVRGGAFRQDLYFRLKGVKVVLPPLRERREDIPLLVRRFLHRYAPETQDMQLDDTARASLLAYDYPGNVRELESIIRRAVLFARDGIITSDALPPEVGGVAGVSLDMPAQIPRTADELLKAKRHVRKQAVRKLERAFLLQALAAADGRPGEAARQAKMNRSQFARMLTQHGLSSSRLVKGDATA